MPRGAAITYEIFKTNLTSVPRRAAITYNTLKNILTSVPRRAAINPRPPEIKWLTCVPLRAAIINNSSLTCVPRWAAIIPRARFEVEST